MARLDHRFYEDRALRDAAKEVLLADIANARNSLSGKAIAERTMGRIGEGAKDVFEVAKGQADDNRGIIAALIGALLLWLSRDPIMEILGLSEIEDYDASAEPELPLDDPEAGDVTDPFMDTPPGHTHD